MFRLPVTGRPGEHRVCETRLVRTYKDLPLLAHKSQAAFDTWLAKYHDSDDGAWIKFAKKASKHKSISYVEAREAAIIYGWIDGLINAFDDDFSVRRFTRRRKRSKWSQINRDIAQTLIDEGRMVASGQAQVDAAKADGRWAAAYPPASKMTVPADLTAALALSDQARLAFKGLSAANRYAVLYALYDAQRPATRERRIKKFVAMLAAGDVPHPGL